ncbi:restriction modification system DNA specificity domain-containing protein [Turneriella parva DSM 21527]|uniref:Restriction modification system DNA specificity domain-containing protein n=1 Tax=Turneriella parva (strain ATCC BAA-1111 / DSM 21527 / NCTC 11395 / H) TaxID=869212 RepID=I4B7Q4_TURPD|nr:restriction modification system DNA specificity domain-containing protein [Turneriella parva DSM 21527]
MLAETTNTVKLDDFATFRYGKMPDKQLLTATGYPVFSGYRIVGYYPDWNTDKGEIIVVARGVGGTGDVKLTKHKCWLTNLSIAITLDRQVCIPEYFYYAFKQDTLRYLDSGTSISQITIDDLRRLQLRLPPLAEQRAIAHILGTLDDKVELNRKMNATLEAMARALFKSWFVDFDPVRKKQAGQPTGLPSEIDALFPGEFEDSALGQIPKGWRVGKLGECSDLNWGDTNTTKSAYTKTGYPAYSAKGQDGFLPYFDFDRTGIVVSAIGNGSGQTILAYGKWSCIKNTMVFWATDSNISTEYLYYSTLGVDKWPRRGSAQPFISQADARNMKLILPNNPLGARFGEIVGHYLKRANALKGEITTLAELRDTLLPKLISGELRVKDAERFVGGVV